MSTTTPMTLSDLEAIATTLDEMVRIRPEHAFNAGYVDMSRLVAEVRRLRAEIFRFAWGYDCDSGADGTHSPVCRKCSAVFALEGRDG